MCSAIDQPTSRRDKQSITVARYRLVPSAQGRYVLSPTSFSFGADAVTSRSSRSGTCSSAGSGIVEGTRRRSRIPAIGVLGHHPGDPLVLHPVGGFGAVVELGGDPRRPVGPVGVVHFADPLRELLISSGTGGAGLGAGLPGVERGPRDLHGRAQPLHLEGVSVVGDELEAAHQRVSPAKYLAAARRMSRSLFSFRSAASSSATRARRRASSCSGGSAPGGGPVRPPQVRECNGTPAAFGHADDVVSMIPRSAAMPTTVAPGVVRYSSTASRRNSSEYVFLATV